jgi:FAD/FMN-containing dehydrogenase
MSAIAASQNIEEPGAAAEAPAGPLPPPQSLHGWGRYPQVVGRERRSEDLEAITRDAILTRGLGRSYGDSSLPPPSGGVVAGSVLADRILAFDPDTGILRAEAGLSLRRLNHVFLPRGWASPVSPGTQLVTLGGMVASDVHGKSHHVDGSFGQHVRSLRLRVADGRILSCSDQHEPELFRATIGGMGLTGHILEVEFRLRRIPSPWILQESERLPNIDAVVERLKQASAEWPYTVCWVDCFGSGAAVGRGILMSGRWAEPSEAPAKPFKPLPRLLTVPFVVPAWVPRELGVRLFNALYYARHGDRVRRTFVHPEFFFYPLDVVGHWNRLYGPRGFTQYQCVLPVGAHHPVLRRLLELLQRRRSTPFLNVVKDCGAEGKGMISFPRPGISFALDMPIRDDLQRVIDEVNELVVAEGGRIYLTKDAFTRAEHFRAMDPRLGAFDRVRRKWDPQRRLKSAQSVRLLGDEP